MGLATGTIRTATENRLIEIIADLDGFTDKLAAGQWVVQGPPNGKPKGRRWVVIGLYDGEFEREGMERGTDPGADKWEINCGLSCNDVADAQQGKQVCEDALNAIADLLAADHRLGVADGGPREVGITRISGPHSDQVEGYPRFCWIDFTISATADIRRTP